MPTAGIEIRITITARNDSLLPLYLLPSNHKVGVNPTTAPNRTAGLKFLTTKQVLPDPKVLYQN